MEQIGDEAVRLVQLALQRPAGSATTEVPGTNGNLVYGTSTVSGFNAALFKHWSFAESEQLAKETGQEYSKVSQADVRNAIIRPPMWVKADWLHMCHLTEALYAGSNGINWRYGEPQRVEVPPAKPSSQYRLTIEARANLRSATWGQPWPELDACTANRILETGNEVLLGQVHVAFVLSRAPGADAANFAVNPFQLQRQNVADQLELLAPQTPDHAPLVYVTDADPAAGTPLRVGCSNFVDHRHMGEAQRFPDVLTGDNGYLSEGNAGEAAGRLLADGQETMVQQQSEGLQPGVGFIGAAKHKLREAARFGLATERLERRPDEGEDVYVDAAQWALLEPDFNAAVGPLDEVQYLTALILAFMQLRQQALEYGAFKEERLQAAIRDGDVVMEG
ncbi:hypothetical protein PG997_000230 [Apiospora hydei]|uniref:Peptidase S74 domain-containing protein n=1 Tax=Apiospora hydei TaxID=1337664 RepID=A0ABR1XA11_9PEZI